MIDFQLNEVLADVGIRTRRQTADECRPPPPPHHHHHHHHHHNAHHTEENDPKVCSIFALFLELIENFSKFNGYWTRRPASFILLVFFGRRVWKFKLYLSQQGRNEKIIRRWGKDQWKRRLKLQKFRVFPAQNVLQISLSILTEPQPKS